MKSIKCILAVQGEGRGHLTQAMAVYEMLCREGHTISCVTVGISDERKLPDFFIRKINVPIIRLASPNFVKDRKNKSISYLRTIADNLSRVKDFRKSLKTLEKIFVEYQPDLVLNFYEPLIGWYAWRRRRSFGIISIAHQYTYLHPAYRFPGGNYIQAEALKQYTRLTQWGSDRVLALNLHDMPAQANKKLTVIPPILRKEVFLKNVGQEDFILVYLLNSGYIPGIIKWHRKNPDSILHCFTDCQEVNEIHNGEWKISDRLTFHALNDQKFLDMMARCKGLVCTAGFESVCEAMYMGKPVMMVPVEGHFEQYCNSRDAYKAGAGIYSDTFKLDRMENCFLFHDRSGNRSFRSWVDGMESRLMGIIHEMFPAGERSGEQQLNDMIIQQPRHQPILDQA